MIDQYFGCSYEEFPHSTSFSEGIQILQAHKDEVSARTLTNVVYRHVDGKDLHLHIILPTQDKNCKKRFPCIVYVQGSAWMKQTHGRELAQLSRFAIRGYVVAIVEYRHSTWAPFPAQIVDAKYAIQFMMENSEQYFVDSSHLIVWGDSSGGHTAMMSVFTKDLEMFKETGLQEYNPILLVDYYGPVDISVMNEVPSSQDHISPSSPEGLLIGGKEVNKELAYPTIATNYISKDKEICPVLIFHGSKDRLVPFDQSVRLYNCLKENGKDVTCYQLYGADHGEEPFWTKEVFDIIEQKINDCN